MNNVAPDAAFDCKAGASDISPLTTGAAAASVAPGGNGGSCFVRALLASAGRPKNSYDFANNSQSSFEPPPLARRASREAIAVPMEPAAGVGAGEARSLDAFTAFAKAPLGEDALGPIAAGAVRTESALPKRW